MRTAAFLVDGGIVYGLGGVGSAYPTYYAAEADAKFRDGRRHGGLAPRAIIALLSTYAVKRTDGTLTLLVINKSCLVQSHRRHQPFRVCSL